MIKANDFKSAFTTMIQKRRTLEFKVGDFISFVVSNFIDDMSNPEYGLSSIYQGKIDPETGTYKVEVAPGSAGGEETLEGEALGDARRKALDGIGASPVFRMPQISIQMEQLPKWRNGGAEDEEVIKNNDILKIHIMDKCASAHDEAISTLRSSYNGFLSGEGWVKTPTDTPYRSAVSASLPAANASEGNSLSSQRTDINTAAMMLAISDKVPTITYGTEASVIKQANLSTENDSALSTIIMTGGGPNPGPLTPQGMGPGNLPLQIFPTQLNMTTLGCPLIEYMQQFFINFGTGTSVDNIYHAVSITHKIEQGNFETAIGFKYVDSYGTFRTHANDLNALLNAPATTKK